MSTILENPLREGIRLERTAAPCVIVIFGASGDLTKRKLIPALYRLVQERLLPAEFAIVGLSRSPMSHDDFRDKMKTAIAQFSENKSVDEEVWNSFARGLYYLSSNIDNADDYKKLGELLEQIDNERGTQGNRVFYLSTAPEHYGEAVKQIGDCRIDQAGK